VPETPTQDRVGPPSRESNRSSYSLSNDNYDLVWKEAKRLNLSMTGAVNVLLEELQQWRSGGRRFTERRRVQRSVAAEDRHRGVLPKSVSVLPK
jgi:hypothetical protein